ncbi:TniQ family protein [Variovorax sp. KK3]|uniref:TniQ family protein n=1 Tax=Variovorax sp. KK3 TaxID=1855728 RepID=UPI00097C970E
MPERYPDELVGSFLTRFIDANALGSKYALLKWLDLPSISYGWQFMDISVLTPIWISLAERLEIGLSDLICELSTKPYWACFQAKRRRAPSVESALGNLEGKLPFSPDFLRSPSHTRLELQFCAQCARQDLRSIGVPSLRRSHQLPGTFVCHEHALQLIHRCPNCATVLAPRSDLVRISLTCPVCGCDLGDPTADVVGRSTPIFRLAVFEHDCLHSAEAPRQASEVAGFVRNFCRESNINMNAVTMEAFGSAFNSWRRESFGGTAHATRIDLQGMPTLCACLVALGFTHHSLHAAIANSAPTVEPTTRRVIRPKSASEARKELLALVTGGQKLNWCILRTRHSSIYWCLVLNDFAWLEKQLGFCRVGLTIPPVRQDRRAAFYAKKQKQSDARTRLLYRDPGWLAEALKSSSNERLANRDDHLVCLIQKAKANWFARSGRPERFSQERAAEVVGLKLHRLRLLNQRLPLGPESPLWESSTHYRLRVLRWTFERFSNCGTLLSSSQLLREANLRNTPDLRSLAARIMHP